MRGTAAAAAVAAADPAAAADSKIKRREDMERQLAEIERDIRTLERGDVVLVVPDSGAGYSGCQYDCC